MGLHQGNRVRHQNGCMLSRDCPIENSRCVCASLGTKKLHKEKASKQATTKQQQQQQQLVVNDRYEDS